MTDISRRKLFGAAGAASLGLAGMVPVASASECGKPVKWNETKEFVSSARALPASLLRSKRIRAA